MIEYDCWPEDGYEGIVAALERATPGGAVRMAPGAYEGWETLKLGNGVTLTGEGAWLFHSGIGPAIEANGVANVTIDGLNINHVIKEVPSCRDPSCHSTHPESVNTEYGIISLYEVVFGWIRNVTVTGARSAHGIYLRGGRETRISGCVLEGGDLSGVLLHQTRSGTIDGNRLQGNASYGIRLKSSYAREIAANECLENLAGGILLITCGAGLITPSEAVIRGNHCYGNGLSEDGGSGIALISSYSSITSENECWGNRSHGINLQTAGWSSNVFSKAVLLRNRCYDNGFNGICIMSSCASEVAENECFGNQNSGIETFGDPLAPSNLAEIRLRGNRCHGNLQIGISIEDTQVQEIVANELWGNRIRGLRVAGGLGHSKIGSINRNCIFHEHNPIAILHGTKLPSDLPENHLWSNTSDPTWLVRIEGGYTTSTHLPTEFAGKPDSFNPMVHVLGAGSLSDPEALARFLEGPGCMHCLTEWWPADELADLGNNSGESVGRYLCQSEESYLRFRREASGDGTMAIWRELTQLAKHHGDEEKKLGNYCSRLSLVTADETALDGLSEEIEALHQALTGRQLQANIPPTVRRAINDLRYGKVSISAPVIVDHAPRSQAAILGRNIASPMFDAGLAFGRSRLTAAIRVLLRTPKIWIATLGTPFLLFLSAYTIGALGTPSLWTEPVAALQRAVHAQIGDIQAFDLFLLRGGLLAFVATVVALIQSSLPRALRWQQPKWMRKRLAVFEGRSSPAWRRWARIRIFEKDIGVVIVRNAQEWAKRDMDELHEVMALRPKNKGLLVVLHSQDCSQIDRAVLRPFAEPLGSGGLDLKSLDGLRLVVGQPAQSLKSSGSLDPIAENTPRGSRLGALLGVKTGDDARLASLIGNIRNGNWSPTDILPMLVIGSTPDLPMQISRLRSERVAEFVPPLEKTLLPFVRIFEADPHLKLELSRDEFVLRKVTEGEALRTRAIHFIGRRNGDTEYVDLIGQPNRRQTLINELVVAFDDPEKHLDYVRRLLACGLLGALQVAVDAIDPKGANSNFRLLLRALRSARQLDAELAAAGGLDAIRREMLDEAAAPLAEAISNIGVPDCPEARRLAGLIACLADRMGLQDASIALGNTELSDTPNCALATRILTAASLYQKLDSSIAHAMVFRYLHHELREADNDLEGKIRDRLAESSRFPTTLSDLIWKVQDVDTLHDLLAAHAPLGGERTAVLALQLAGATDTEVKLRSANAIDGLRKSGAVLMAPPRGTQRCVPHSNLEIMRLVELVENPRIQTLLAQKQDFLPSVEPLLDVELGYFDPSDAEVKNVVEIQFDD